MENTIYALKVTPVWADEIYESLKKGEGRFGWSYIDTANLESLNQKISDEGWDNLTEDEQNCYNPFLLGFKDGDYVVYINVPRWGECTVAKVTGTYYWIFDDHDFNHRFSVNPNSIYIFNRNDSTVHPTLSSRLKLQGRWWRIYAEEEFYDLINVLEKGEHLPYQETSTNLKFLSHEIQPYLLNITKCIHRTHPNYDLESLLVDIFKNVPRVTEVNAQGRSGAEGDYGADILVWFESGLPIYGLGNQSLLVVQVKSHEGTGWDKSAVDDIRCAFEHYPQATAGLIISTVDDLTQEVEEEINKLIDEKGKPVVFLFGTELAKFLLRYGSNLLT